MPAPLTNLLDLLATVPGLDIDLRLRATTDLELVLSGPLPVPDEARARVPRPARMLLPKTIQLAPSTARATLSPATREITLTHLDLHLANAAAQSAYALVGGTPFVLEKLGAAITGKDPTCALRWGPSGPGHLPLTLSWT